MKKILCVVMTVCLIMLMTACALWKEADETLSDIPDKVNGETTNPDHNAINSEPITKPATEPITEPAAEATTLPPTEPTAASTEAPTESPAISPTKEPEEEEKKPTTDTAPAPTEHRHSYTTTVVDPTCTEGGITVDHCSCGENRIYDSVPALGHTFGEWATAVEPTTTANGLRVRTCSVCDYQEVEPIEKLKACETHDWVVTEKETVDAYPLRHYGYVTTACSVCGEKKGTEARYFTPDYIDYAAEVSTIISLVNAMRAGEGLSRLTTGGDWNSWAATRAQEISIYYSHNRPNGASWGRNDGVDMAFGENIARNANSGAEFYYGFLNSPQHCGLMKEPDATGIAVSIYVNEYGNSYCAMVIYGPMGIVEEKS